MKIHYIVHMCASSGNLYRLYNNIGRVVAKVDEINFQNVFTLDMCNTIENSTS